MIKFGSYKYIRPQVNTLLTTHDCPGNLLCNRVPRFRSDAWTQHNGMSGCDIGSSVQQCVLLGQDKQTTSMIQLPLMRTAFGLNDDVHANRVSWQAPERCSSGYPTPFCCRIAAQCFTWLLPHALLACLCPSRVCSSSCRIPCRPTVGVIWTMQLRSMTRHRVDKFRSRAHSA